MPNYSIIFTIIIIVAIFQIKFWSKLKTEGFFCLWFQFNFFLFLPECLLIVVPGGILGSCKDIHVQSLCPLFLYIFSVCFLEDSEWLILTVLHKNEMFPVNCVLKLHVFFFNGNIFHVHPKNRNKCYLIYDFLWN